MEQNFLLSQESQLESDYPQLIQPFWQNLVTQGHFTGVANITIAYAFVKHPNAIGSIVISSGRIESFIKYKEVVYDLHQNGYSVFIHDHRGQGLSGRMTTNLHMGYVKDFSDYVADFKIFIDQVVLPNSQSKPRLLCHSMGCAIGAKLVLTYPTLFSRAAFSAPMFGIRPALPAWFARFLLKCHFLFNRQIAYFAGQLDYVNQPFKGNDLTHSRVRYDIFRQEYEEQPQIQLGGVTGEWLKAATVAMDEVERLASQISIPVLVMQAASDKVVDNKRQRKVLESIPDKTFLVIKGAKHELLAEQDCYRQTCLSAVLKFFTVSE